MRLLSKSKRTSSWSSCTSWFRIVDVNYDVIVIGAGAAGMMCAAQAGQRGRRVLLVEHYHALGEKIRISGGGRCNFTNVHAGPANYLSRNPDFCRSALARYTPAHFIALVERHGIAYHEKKLGQLFCDDTARRHHRDAQGRVRPRPRGVAHALRRRRRRARRRRVRRRTRGDTRTAARRSSSRPAASPCRRSARRPSATGSRSSSAWRSCRRARRWCRSRSRPRRSRATATCPASRSTPRSRATAARFRENLLFTHRGLSGPAILQISSYWDGRSPLVRRPAARDATRTRGSPRTGTSDARLPNAARRTPAEALRAGVVRRARRRGAGPADSGPARCATSRRASRPGTCCRRARSATTRPK